MNEKIAITKVAEAQNNHYLKCFAYAKEFIKTHETFTSEDIIDAYVQRGICIPAEMRVFGAVVKELVRQGYLIHFGFSKYKKPSGHSKICNVWSSNIYKINIL